MSNENIGSEKSNGSANETDNLSFSENQLREVKILENTPFAIVKVDDQYFVACGKYRLTGLMDNMEDATEYAYRIDWNNITAVIGIIVQEEINTHLGRTDAINRLYNEAESEN